jgi:hypothetical protein
MVAVAQLLPYQEVPEAPLLAAWRGRLDITAESQCNTLVETWPVLVCQ